MPIKIGIIEDDIVLCDSFVKYLSAQEEFQILFAYHSMEACLSNAHIESSPDIILCDIHLPGVSGVEGIPALKRQFDDAEIVMCTVFSDDENIFKALCNGATGYLQKNETLSVIKEAIIEAYNGGAPMSPGIARKVVNYFKPKKKQKTSVLTPKELQVVQGLVDGLSYKLIAERLQISLETVRSHIKQIYKKLRVNSKGEVIAKSFRGEL